MAKSKGEKKSDGKVKKSNGIVRKESEETAKKDDGKAEDGNGNARDGMKGEDRRDSNIRYKYRPAGSSGDLIDIDAHMLRQKILTLEKEQKDDSVGLSDQTCGRNKAPYASAGSQKHKSSVASHKASRDYRWEQHHALMTAYSHQEDFLYYQNRRHRLQRMSNLDPKTTGGPTTTPKDSILFSYKMDHELIRETLDYYDDQKVGFSEVPTGRGDPDDESAPGKAKVGLGPADLHLWTPQHRRELVGVGCRIQDSDRVRGPSQIPLDLPSIENRRKEVDCQPSQACTEGAMPDYKNHDERRLNERLDAIIEVNDIKKARGMLLQRGDSHSWRPSTAQMRLQKNGEVTTHHERFNEIQVGNRLFIAAKESSFDWRTSYDCLGIVEHSYTVDVLQDERDLQMIIPDSDGTDDKGTPRAIDTDINTPVKQPAPVPGNSDNTTGPVVTISTISTKRSLEGPIISTPSRPTRHSARSHKNQAKTVQSGGDTTQILEAGPPKAYGYQYEAFEFCRPKKSPNHPYKKRITTRWYEATEGRREWHIGQILPDSSPPSSPPRMNLSSTILESSVPEGIPDLDLDTPNRQQCSLGKNCRKWWPHTTVQECWQGNLEGPLYLGDEDEDPIRPPVLSIQEKDYLLPIANSGRDIYRSRLEDHYGRIRNGGLPWPRFGARVPYAPTTIMDDVGLEAGGSSKREFPVTRSLAVPLIPIPQTGGQPFDTNFPVEQMDIDGDSDSDNEGDLFFQSYHAVA